MGERDELIARLEALTESDRDVDGMLHLALHPARDCFNPDKGFEDGQIWSNVEWDWFDTPTYTASLDAAVALVERVRPIGTGPGKWHWYADDRSSAVWPDGIYDESAVQAANPAIALCLALLRSSTEEDR